MSRSSPGRYALHEFVKNVYRVRATDEQGIALTITRPNAYGWNISGHHGTVVIEYTLFGDHADGTYAAIDETHAHLNLPATLVWAHGYEDAPATLAFDPPPGSGWRVATQLVPQANGEWSAPNLEWLMDSPVELSQLDMPEWKVENATFRLALHHRGTPDQARAYAELCKAVVLEEEGIFGGFPHYDNGTYTFLVDYLPYASGDGMEHRNSTVISGPFDLPDTGHTAIGTVSHEFFHSWNVRRMRPRSLEPFDFERTDMSGELWFAEGFTNYYGPLTLKRAGVSSLDRFLGEMSGAVNQVLTRPGRNLNSAVEMSQLAPFVDAAKSVDATNFGNIFISYYTYGEALALGIDLAIRQQFPGKSLDDWMRTVWKNHADIERPYVLGDLQRDLAETTQNEKFAAEIFEHHIIGKQPLDYAALLAPAGIKLQKRHSGKAWFGPESFTMSGGSVELNAGALIGSPLYTAGLDRGDHIETCVGKALKELSDLSACIEHRSPGESVQLSGTSRAGRQTWTVTLAEDPAVEVVTYEKAGLPITAEQKAFRDQWLHSKALHPLPGID